MATIETTEPREVSWKDLPCPECRADVKKRTKTNSWGPVKVWVCTNCGHELGRESNG